MSRDRDNGTGPGAEAKPGLVKPAVGRAAAGKRVDPAPDRCWLRLPSGRRLDLLDPTPFDWDDRDLAIGLARTYRWGGHSVWPLPLSVAQHSLVVVALRVDDAPGGLDPMLELRELLHDAEEGFLGFDALSPLKPFLGQGFATLSERLSEAVRRRYGLRAWNEAERRAHKRCDRIAAASEAVHVAGWTEAEVRRTLGITAAVQSRDPVAERFGEVPWAPWPPQLAAERFEAELGRLLRRAGLRA